jgi:NitT/TauT family transport system substrate-binding protein
VTAGITKDETNLAGLVDLSALNTVLKQAGKPEVNASGLDKK